MKKIIGFFCFISPFLAFAQPQATITNGPVTARLYLPDPQEGYYRGTRFDWSGVIAELTSNKHTYFGVWNTRYDPTLHDAISGPVEEFGTIGYKEAKVGETFLKIGVGLLRKPDEQRNDFTTPYVITNGGQWTHKVNTDQVTFQHVLMDAPSGNGYTYEKTVKLVKNEARLRIEHRLKNTGSKPIENEVYNHNFLVLDGQSSGPDFTITFPFTVTTDDSLRNMLTINGKQLSYARKLEKGQSIYVLLKGYGSTPADYAFQVENRKTGAGVRVSADRPLSKLAFWTNQANLSPEPFIRLHLAPGEETTWTITYDFYGSNPR